ncbi:hypothetical protein LH464_04455 [Neorhizobium sp. T786]|uniref:hypothetical protein n=1 Tax=Pseudorhizobium xiangyangii TaxID=2883104 RepID=UPI001D00037E|nr:hypothetical protein [Neorhizobium xiangyangii]MCB5201730.1 hypothetical protein [Neorhizobium xiangyangii]
MAANAEATVTLSLIDRITGPIRRISARIAAVSRTLGIDRITGAVGRLGTSLKGLGSGLMATTGRLSAFLTLFGAGGAGVIATAYGLAKSAADVGAELTEMSGKLGIGAEALQEYRFAAKMSGVEIATFDKGVEKLGINAVEASKGNKQLAAAFKSLGIRVRGSGGAMRSTEDILDDTMAALSGIEDPLKRNQLAFKLFGKSGVDLTKMLGDGAEGLRDLREEARRTGNVMSEDAARAGDELGDRVDALVERVTGLKNLLGVQLIPVFNEAVKGITDWADANAELIRSTVTDWAKDLVGFIRALIDPTSEVRRQIDGLATSFTAFMTAIRPVVDFLGGPMNAALIAVASWIMGPLVVALATLGAAFVKLGIVILSTPIGWILGGLALVAGAVYVIYQQWDEFAAYWSSLWDRVKAGFQQGFIHGVIALLKEFNPVTHIVRGINAMIEYFTGVDLIEHGSAMIQTLATGIESGWAAIMEWLRARGQAIAETVSGFYQYMFDAGAILVNAIWDGLKSKWDSVVAWLRGAVANLVSWLPESIQTRLGVKVEGVPAGPVNDNAGAAGAAASSTPARLIGGVPTGASQEAAIAAANTNAPPTSGDVEQNYLTNSSNTNTTTMKATVNITAPPGSDAAAIGAAVRRELDNVNRRAAAANGSSLSD